MVEHWKEKGFTKKQIEKGWNDYVPAHLLPRLTGFELMMAPYAIAHMKIGLKLFETGYKFGSDERARIFLTNALEPARDLDMEFLFMSVALAHEAQASNKAKSNVPYTIVIGNPPYANFGQLNKSEHVRMLLQEYKKGLSERKLNLDDDYIKFIRLAHNIIEVSRFGCLSYITNNSYIDGVTHRRMRETLVNSFNSIKTLDLRGSVRRSGEIDKQINDENVFDIQQGVAIISAYQNGARDVRDVSTQTLIGTREDKFSKLISSKLSTSQFDNVDAVAPLFLFCVRAADYSAEYDYFVPIPEVFSIGSTGVKTHLDRVFVTFEKVTTINNIKLFSEEKDDTDVNKRASKAKKIALVRKALAESDFSYESYAYRPFDSRCVFYSRTAIPAGDHRYPVMQHLSDGNMALCTVRQISQGRFSHAFVVESIFDMCCLSTSTKECGYGYPMMIKSATDEGHLDSNLTTRFVGAIANVTGKSTSDPRSAFRWIYSILHSATYRARYVEFLKSDFPRIPLPKDKKVFDYLVPLGAELVSLHLLRPDEAKILKNPDIRFVGKGEALVAKGYPKYENGKVMINGSRWFEDVPRETWEFHIGGYQVCQKWLKDRAGKGGKNPHPGRVLTDDDILHYRRVVTALTETRRIMTDIDKVIDKHGGWPDAFAKPDEAKS